MRQRAGAGRRGAGGVSRTSKTPTSIYLANRGVKVANVPVVPDCPLPELHVEPSPGGRADDQSRLVQMMNRLRQLHLEREAKEPAFEGDYAELERVRAELVMRADCLRGMAGP